METRPPKTHLFSEEERLRALRPCGWCHWRCDTPAMRVVQKHTKNRNHPADNTLMYSDSLQVITDTTVLPVFKHLPVFSCCLRIQRSWFPRHGLYRPWEIEFSGISISWSPVQVWFWSSLVILFSPLGNFCHMSSYSFLKIEAKI